MSSSPYRSIGKEQIVSDFNPNRIVLARRLEGISQKELSASTGISQAKLSKLQNGISVLDKRDAMRLSSALDYPISFFERRDEILPLSSLTYRKTSKSTMAELSAVSSEYSLLASAVQHVASRLNLAGRTSGFAQIAPRTHGNLSEHAIDELADAARSNLGLPATGAVPNVTRTLERSGIIVAPMRSLGFGSEAHLTSEGVTDPSPGRMYCVGYLGSGELSGDRLRFTKAHEFGHLLLHGYRKPDSPQQLEREAHLFASAFLFPRKDAERVLTPSMSLRDFLPVKAGWGLSIAAIISRSYSLGIIDRQRYQSLFIQLSSRGWKKHEPVPVEIERPLLLKQMIESAYGTPTSTGLAVDSLAISTELGTPFRYLDYWSDGLADIGEQWGVSEQRFAPPNQYRADVDNNHTEQR
jgi:transcriptional regulator with XRE-family HTH domain